MSKKAFDKIKHGILEAVEDRAVQIVVEASGHAESDAKVILLKIEKLGWELRPSDLEYP